MSDEKAKIDDFSDTVSKRLYTRPDYFTLNALNESLTPHRPTPPSLRPDIAPLPNIECPGTNHTLCRLFRSRRPPYPSPSRTAVPNASPLAPRTARRLRTSPTSPLQQTASLPTYLQLHSTPWQVLPQRRLQNLSRRQIKMSQRPPRALLQRETIRVRHLLLPLHETIRASTTREATRRY